MKKLILIICLSLITFSSIQAQTVESKKCKICGKPLKECPYKGKHKQSQQSNNTSTTNQQPSKPKPNTVRMEDDDIVFTLDGTTYRYKMVYVSGGSDTIGCNGEKGSGCFGDERPVHSVTVSGYYMGETEVTQALWEAVMGSNPSICKGNTLPVVQVSYNDVKDFISRLNSKTGMTFRLPTEAEWEFAARGGNSSRGYKYSGSNNIDDVAWYNGNRGRNTHPVKQKQANELGLYDMSGNVWEWCSDWYGSYSSDWQSNPKGPSNGSYRVYRGGSCFDNAGGCRVSYRGRDTPSYRNYDLGFRLAR